MIEHVARAVLPAREPLALRTNDLVVAEAVEAPFHGDPRAPDVDEEGVVHVHAAATGIEQQPGRGRVLDPRAVHLEAQGVAGGDAGEDVAASHRAAQHLDELQPLVDRAVHEAAVHQRALAVQHLEALSGHVLRAAPV